MMFRGLAIFVCLFGGSTSAAHDAPPVAWDLQALGQTPRPRRFSSPRRRLRRLQGLRRFVSKARRSRGSRRVFSPTSLCRRRPRRRSLRRVSCSFMARAARRSPRGRSGGPIVDTPLSLSITMEGYRSENTVNGNAIRRAVRVVAIFSSSIDRWPINGCITPWSPR